MTENQLHIALSAEPCNKNCNCLCHGFNKKGEGCNACEHSKECERCQVVVK